ncbi:AraC family transcriptional regulator [Mucilaginibacter conchicola]|uniref:AraC family transcriptional regulator n=1 Tax=Mucilaginibacter conchicola TaxID=2303333 RepID=A0A372NYN5_9SPHI|nr:AraC family transcriptional regulator [Mucilaginibacter conchicola]RFZ94627.1 AraC family transcriptional regulator [Mucilaginibacter conchicola]
MSMRIASKIEGSDEWLFIEEVPSRYSVERPLSEKRIAIKKHPVQLNSYQVCSGGLFLMYAEMHFEEAVKIFSEVSGETITSQFIFAEKPIDAKKSTKVVHHGHNRHNIRYIPAIKSTHEVTRGTRYNYFLMVLSKEYYFHLVNHHSMLHADFVKEIDKGRYTSMAVEDMAVTYEMRRVIDDILLCKRSGDLKRLFTESKVLELLMLQLEQIQFADKEETFQLKPDDLKKVEEARAILDKRFNDPPTLKELSRMVGLNEFKLKGGFKEYFSITVYKYVTRLRMEMARRLILEKNKTIGQISAEVGYRHQTHLTDAFKKYFGILPSEVE